MIQSNLFWIVPIASLLALFFAWFFFRNMMKESEGTDTMKNIASHVRKGAMAYIRQQYKIVGIFFLVLQIIFIELLLSFLWWINFIYNNALKERVKLELTSVLKLRPQYILILYTLPVLFKM